MNLNNVGDRKSSTLNKACWILPVVACLLTMPTSKASAQIVPDTTLPSNSAVNQIGSIDQITGGTTAGNNLFHSFQQFSVLTGKTAFFNNSLNIKNIITRVTGQSISNIDGIIRANGTANLFLINPNGITFGSNAQLNIGGSFIGSTAQSLRFADGTEFSAVAPQTSLLTVSAPLGLQYGSNPSPIIVQGPGNSLGYDPVTFETDRSLRPPGLQVQPGQTLALIGGDLNLQGGNLTAEEGRIELGSVRGGGVVTLIPTNPGWTMSYAGIQRFGNINLSQAASADVSGNGAGEIRVQGQQLSVTDGSALLALTLGNTIGKGITIKTTEAVEVLSASNDFVSSILTDANATAIAQGGNLTIETPYLHVADGGQISAATFGAGSAGNLTVKAQTVELAGGIAGFASSGLFTNVNFGSGQGGQLTIKADQLRVVDGAQIAASTFDAGNAGSVNVQAKVVELTGGLAGLGASGIFAATVFGSGNGGNVSITADQLQVSNGARVSVNTFTAGTAGNLNVKAQSLELTGTSTGGIASGLFAQVDAAATGNGGTLTVAADHLRVAGGAAIAASTFGAGNAGNVGITAQTIELTGGSQTSPSGLFTTVESGATGNGGNLTIRATRLSVTDGAQVASRTSGAGNAGTLTVSAQDVELLGQNQQGRSGLFASAIAGTGAGGDLTISANRLMVRDGATISVSNFPSSNNAQTAPGTGSVGNLQIGTTLLQLDNGATLTANSAGGNQGNIILNSKLITLRRGSAIATNALGSATGGNISINTDFLIAVADENSDITANSADNRGGGINITARGIFGIEPQPQLTALSDITVLSGKGVEFAGTIDIKTPDLDPTQGLVELPAGLVNASSQIATTCDRTRNNAFLITGRGGLPQDASQTLRGESVWQDLRLSGVTEASKGSGLETRNQQPDQRYDLTAESAPIIEAQGWVINANGQITLVANRPQTKATMDSYVTACSGNR